MNMQIVILVLIFLAVTGLAMGATLWFGRDPALRQRLNQLVNPESKGEKSLIAGSEWQARVIKAVGPMAKLSTPKVGWDESSLRVRFMQAGLRETAWPAIYFAAKTVLALLWPGLFVLYQGLSAMQMTATNTILVLVLLTALGYYLPNVLLANLIKHRKREVEDALPDALDMMLVCVEAGLGLDAAMNRAASEIGLRSEAMADELNLVALELRMGVKRDQALRNMALRTGVDDVASFVAMLVQADRFGTNVADALRIEAETMRTHRRLRAEERAAKIPLKLLFPLIFFIFPSLMLVLLGPAMISIYRVLLPTMSGG
ncbi:type II secretion system F family protein [Rhodoferax sp.]|uniref:type II secretion system F family protein n=1 Tax=Rhodoferax sp. TaxID=50421 RepID=UPI00271FB2BD|nr:type II secretion system F family protein [Rhodoferax sp.]MDO9145780.1 type II secretion system F family protein [Rhodoferax sp.]MDP2441018.1 type II secretion system F family protein [Rhodoferax sp.]MDZ4208816.1 type II secretion system F family protein [Rhodoferax sp.]